MDKSKKNEKEIRELNEWMKTNGDGRELKRALAVKLSLEGWTYEALAKPSGSYLASLLNMSKTFVGEWIGVFKRQGIEGLKLAYKGAKSYLMAPQRDEVFKLLHEQ